MEATKHIYHDQSEHASATACRVADLLLDIGTVLQGSGAHCGRISRNIERVAATWGYSMDLFITFTGKGRRNEAHVLVQQQETNAVPEPPKEPRHMQNPPWS